MVAQIGSELGTPSSNTGLKCQGVGVNEERGVSQDVGLEGVPAVRLEASVDYLMGTSRFPNFERFEEAVAFVGGCFGQHLVWENKPMFSGITWESTVRSLDGLKIGYNRLEGGGIHAWFCMPGRLFHLVNLRDGWRCCLGLGYKYRFKATRIDLKLRDYARRKTPLDLFGECNLGNVARKVKCEIAASGNIGEDLTYTLYLGSRQSEQFLRIYDSLPVHGLNAIDWELQSRDEKADAIFKSLIGISDSDLDDVGDLIGAYIASTVLGSVEFIDRKPKVRLSRQPRQDWWQEFINEAGGQIRHSVARPSRTVERVFNWLEKQVVTMMSALQEGMGRADFQKWLTKQLEISVERFQPYHDALVQECKRYLQINY